MMSTQKERLDALLETFKLANRARWSVGSTTIANKRRLKQLADKAEGNYLTALNQALSANGSSVEMAYEAVKLANKAVLNRLKNKAKILKRIEDIQNAIDKGLKLIQTAKGQNE